MFTATGAKLVRVEGLIDADGLLEGQESFLGQARRALSQGFFFLFGRYQVGRRDEQVAEIRVIIIGKALDKVSDKLVPVRQGVPLSRIEGGVFEDAQIKYIVQGKAVVAELGRVLVMLADAGLDVAP